jgi:hypothetical protein
MMLAAHITPPAVMRVTPTRNIHVSNRVIDQILCKARLNCWTLSDQHWREKLIDDSDQTA